VLVIPAPAFQNVMPRQASKKQIEVRLEKEIVNDETFDVLYIDNREIVAFHLKNIETLNLEHNSETMLNLITNYFKGTS
jgi:hypothetical protein